MTKYIPIVARKIKEKQSEFSELKTKVFDNLRRKLIDITYKISNRTVHDAIKQQDIENDIYKIINPFDDLDLGFILYKLCDKYDIEKGTIKSVKEYIAPVKNLRKNNKSGAVGVCWNMKCRGWHATVTINKKQKTVGYFNTIKLAVTARNNFIENNLTNIK